MGMVLALVLLSFAMPCALGAPILDAKTAKTTNAKSITAVAIQVNDSVKNVQNANIVAVRNTDSAPLKAVSATNMKTETKRLGELEKQYQTLKADNNSQDYFRNAKGYLFSAVNDSLKMAEAQMRKVAGNASAGEIKNRTLSGIVTTFDSYREKVMNSETMGQLREVAPKVKEEFARLREEIALQESVRIRERIKNATDVTKNLTRALREQIKTRLTAGNSSDKISSVIDKFDSAMDEAGLSLGNLSDLGEGLVNRYITQTREKLETARGLLSDLITELKTDNTL